MSKLFSNLPRPRQGLIGHRGAAGLAPENTLTSIKKVVELGLNWIEFDIQCCQGGEWIVFHDEMLERTTNGKGLVSKTPLSILQMLDAGSWFDEQYAATRIPTLKEVLQTAAALKLHPNIEVKTFESDKRDKYSKMQDFLLQLKTLWPQNLPLPLVSSFDIEVLEILRSLSTSLPLGYNSEEDSEQPFLLAKEHHLDSLHIPAKLLTNTKIKTALNNELPLLVYTVNEPHLIQMLLQQGATAVFSDLTNYVLLDI